MRLKYRKSFAVVSLGVVVLICCFAGTSRTNQVVELLKTNAPCRVRLQPAWTGIAEHTVRTGFFSSAQTPQYGRFQRELRFDWFSYSETPSPFHFGPRI